MSRPLSRLLPVAFCLFACGVAVNAAGARFWEVGTLADFLKGDATSLSIDLHGRLLLGPSLAAVADTDAPVLWGAVVAPDGTVFVGSGNDGKVMKVTRAGKFSLFYDSTELEVHALAFAPGGGVYVGTSPDGRVYKVDASGNATPFFDPEDKYIWALASQPDGTLFVATGDKGLIYKVAPDGKGSVFYRTKATHVRSMLMTSGGDLIAGTESPGRVFRINPSGTGFLLLDSNLQEVSAIRPGPGGIVYAAALSGKPSEDRSPVVPPMPEPSRPPVPTVTAEITGMTVVDVGTPTSVGGGRDSSRGAGKGAVYRIQPDGVWDIVWTSADDTPYDVALDRDGAVLVATGSKGKIYRVAGEPSETTLLVRAPAQQVTSMVQDAGGLLVSTANPGKVFRLSATPAATGSYESDVRDAESVATWGTISWRGTVPGGGDVKLFTRTGNSAAPDDTWSAWSSAYRRGEGEQIVSPKARYLQWKLELTGSSGASPVITSVTIAYQQRNQRPEITSITIHAPGLVFQRPFSSGEAEIAGYDGPPVTQRARWPADRPRRAAARTAQLPEGPADDRLEGAGRQRRRPELRHSVPPRRRYHVESAEAEPSGSAVCLGHDVRAERNVRHQGACLRCAGEPARRRARGRARERHVRRRQLAAVDHGGLGHARQRPHDGALHGEGRRLARCSASSTRSRPTAGVRFTRRTGLPTHEPRNSSWCSIRMWGTARSSCARSTR